MYKMKKCFLWTLAALLACGPVYMQARNKNVNAYFHEVEMPDLLKWMPAPPDTTGSLYVNDIMQYMWGKAQWQDSVRREIARRDAVYGIKTVAREFSPLLGVPISKEETPEIYKVLEESLATCDSICTRPKAHYMRRRPFVRFGEHTITPKDERYLRGNGSYPSGHAILGWAAALLLTEINPEAQDTLLARGLMYGESRVIVGAHWQSDVDMGFLAASAAYARLHTSERFLEQMRRARAEFAEKRQALAQAAKGKEK